MSNDKPCPHVEVQPINMFPPPPPFFLPCGPQAGDMIKPICDPSMIPAPRQCGPCMLINIPYKNKPEFQFETKEKQETPKEKHHKKESPETKPTSKPKKKKRQPSLGSLSSSSTSLNEKNEAAKEKKKPKKKGRGLRSKSRELRASIFYSGCDCEKRNGLQDDCRRTECRGSPQCRTVPPSCGPSEFSNAKHLVRKSEQWLKTHSKKIGNEFVV